MRDFLGMIEAGRTAARTVDLERALGGDELAALRSAGVLRAEDREGFEEISRTDLARALRKLYHVQARGLPVPTAYGKDWATLGWSQDDGGERAVILCDQPSQSLRFALLYPHRARILVPCARSLSAAVREQHGPGRVIEVEALEESLRVVDGRLARGGRPRPRRARLRRRRTGGPRDGSAPHPRRAALERRRHRACRRQHRVRLGAGPLAPLHLQRSGHGAPEHSQAAAPLGDAARPVRRGRRLRRPATRRCERVEGIKERATSPIAAHVLALIRSQRKRRLIRASGS